MRCIQPQVRSQSHRFSKWEYTYPCGNCFACKVVRKKSWTLRLLAESLLYDQNLFFTLTYEKEPLQGLVKQDIKNFIRRLYARLGYECRYFICGEYGSRTSRAHYHGILFNCGINNETLSDAWGLGFVKLASFTTGRASYVAKYVTKDQTETNEIERGREKEFLLCSRRPGIGRKYLEDYFINLRLRGWRLPAAGELPDASKKVVSINVLRCAGKLWPMDRYVKELMFSIMGEPAQSDSEGALIRELQKKQFSTNKVHRSVWDPLSKEASEAQANVYRAKRLRYISRMKNG